MSITKKKKKNSLVQRLTFDVHSFMPVEKKLKKSDPSMEYFPRANWYTYSIFTFKFVALLPTLLMKNASEKTRTEYMRTQQSNADVSLPDGMVLLDILYLLQAKLHVKEKLETHEPSPSALYIQELQSNQDNLFMSYAKLFRTHKDWADIWSWKWQRNIKEQTQRIIFFD